MSFPKHASYKDSGVGWLGEVPQHWTLTTLRRLVVNTNAGEVIDRTFWGGEAELLYTCAIDPLQCDYDGFPDSKRTLPNDLLLTRNGTPYVHKPIVNSIYTNVVQRITLDDGLDREFTALAVQNAADNLRGYGVSIESLNYDLWKALPVGVPPLDEQKSISSFLDVETSKIDGLVSEQRRLIELLKEKRQAVISHAVTKGLNPNAPMKPSGIQWLGDVPEHWKLIKLNLLTHIGNGSTPDRKNLMYWTNGTYPWLNSSVVNQSSVTESDQFVTQLALDECHLPKIEPPAVLVGITGQGRTRGMATILETEATINQHVAFLKPLDARTTVSFIHRYFQMAYDYIRDESEGAGSTKGAITCGQIEKLKLPLPPIGELTEITEHLDAETEALTQLEAEAERAIELLQERRTALISAAVTGKIDVRGFAHEEAA